MALISTSPIGLSLLWLLLESLSVLRVLTLCFMGATITSITAKGVLIFVYIISSLLALLMICRLILERPISISICSSQHICNFLVLGSELGPGIQGRMSLLYLGLHSSGKWTKHKIILKVLWREEKLKAGGSHIIEGLLATRCLEFSRMMRSHGKI